MFVQRLNGEKPESQRDCCRGKLKHLLSTPEEEKTEKIKQREHKRKGRLGGMLGSGSEDPRRHMRRSLRPNPDSQRHVSDGHAQKQQCNCFTSRFLKQLLRTPSRSYCGTSTRKEKHVEDPGFPHQSDFMVLRLNRESCCSIKYLIGIFHSGTCPKL